METTTVPPSPFSSQQLDVFQIPDFAGRMAAVREHITPRLLNLGDQLIQPLSDLIQEPLYLHIARHLRRSVNPPEATWAAFARTRRAYKPTVHVRVAACGEGIRTLVFVEDYAEDKLLFANNLRKRAKDIARCYRTNSNIRDYSLEPGVKLGSVKALQAFARRLSSVKGQHAIFGACVDVSQLKSMSNDQLVETILASAAELMPIYDCGRHAV